jgi:N-acetylneuraminic acid mutarotase
MSVRKELLLEFRFLPMKRFRWETKMKSLSTLSGWLGIVASCVVLANLLAVGPAFSKSTGAQGSWSTQAPLPTKRFEVGVVALGGKVYVIGGESDGKPASQLNTEYDPATDRWRDRAPIPHETSHAGVAGLNGKIYVIGGFIAVPHAGALDLAFEYDVATNKWRQLPPLSSPRGSIGLAVVGGKVHAIGGRGLYKVTVNTHEVYDPATGKWSKARPLPKARDHAGVIVVDGLIHVIGGRTAGGSDLVNLHDVYDPRTDSWQSAAPLPTARSGGAVVDYRGLILYVGGECKTPKPGGGGEGFTENEAYDPKTNMWLTLAPLPEQRNGFGGAVVGQHAYFAGGSVGCGGAPTSDQLLLFTLP